VRLSAFRFPFFLFHLSPLGRGGVSEASEREGDRTPEFFSNVRSPSPQPSPRRGEGVASRATENRSTSSGAFAPREGICFPSPLAGEGGAVERSETSRVRGEVVEHATRPLTRFARKRSLSTLSRKGEGRKKRTIAAAVPLSRCAGQDVKVRPPIG
jgi:hypothetical protein